MNDERTIRRGRDGRFYVTEKQPEGHLADDGPYESHEEAVAARLRKLAESAKNKEAS